MSEIQRSELEKLLRVVARARRDDQMVVAVPTETLDQLLTTYRLLLIAAEHGARFAPADGAD